MTGPKNMSASIKGRLLHIARERHEDFNYLLIRYIQERILYRLSQSQHANLFVLKGAALFTLWQGAPHRPTKDTDFLGFGPPDPEHLRRIFEEILETPVEDDGLEFNTADITAHAIRENAVYDGIRLSIAVGLGSARNRVQIDVGFGDSTVPKPVDAEFPTILDMPAPTIRAYQPETVVAEKFEAIVALGMGNSRLKDYFDLDCLFRDFPLDPKVLREAILATFEKRQRSIPHEAPLGLTEEFSGDAEKQKQWSAFLSRAAPESSIRLSDVVENLRAQLTPILTDLTESRRT